MSKRARVHSVLEYHHARRHKCTDVFSKATMVDMGFLMLGVDLEAVDECQRKEMGKTVQRHGGKRARYDAEGATRVLLEVTSATGDEWAPPDRVVLLDALRGVLTSGEESPAPLPLPATVEPLPLPAPEPAPPTHLMPLPLPVVPRLHLGMQGRKNEPDLSIVEYQGKYSHVEMAGLLVARDRELHDLKDELNKSRQATRNRQKARRQARDELVLVQDERDILHAKINLRPREHGHVSLIGGFTLASSRSCGYTSSQAIVKILGGRDEQGALRSKSVVDRYEMYLWATGRIKEQLRQESVDDLLRQIVPVQTEAVEVPEPVPEPPRPKRFRIEAVEFRGDATYQDAINTEKIYQSRLRKLVHMPDDECEAETIVDSFTDIQTVRVGC